MLPGYVEFIVAYERHKDLLCEAEQRRLINSLQSQQSNDQSKLHEVCHWLGERLVNWGLKLQGHTVPLPSPVETAAVTDGKCC